MTWPAVIAHRLINDAPGIVAQRPNVSCFFLFASWVSKHKHNQVKQSRTKNFSARRLRNTALYRARRSLPAKSSCKKTKRDKKQNRTEQNKQTNTQTNKQTIQTKQPNEHTSKQAIRQTIKEASVILMNRTRTHAVMTNLWRKTRELQQNKTR